MINFFGTLFVFLLISNQRVLAAEKQNNSYISIQNNRVLIEEKVSLSETNKSGLGFEWQPILNEHNPKVLSVFLNNKWIIPYRRDKSGNLIIGDLNKKKTTEDFVSVRYYLKIYKNKTKLILNNRLSTRNIYLKTNSFIKTITCDDNTNIVRLKDNEETILPCKNSVVIETEKKYPVWKNLFRL